MKALYTLLFISFFIFTGCEEDPVVNEDGGGILITNTLNDNNVGNGNTDELQNYFYDLEDNIDIRYNVYNNASIETPLLWGEEDTLNFRTFPDFHVLYLDSSNFSNYINRIDGEPYIDFNENGTWDDGESFTDMNLNEAWNGVVEEFTIEDTVVIAEGKSAVETLSTITWVPNEEGDAELSRYNISTQLILSPEAVIDYEDGYTVSYSHSALFDTYEDSTLFIDTAVWEENVIETYAGVDFVFEAEYEIEDVVSISNYKLFFRENTDCNDNGILDLVAEEFIDSNNSGEYDEGEEFTDLGNGVLDSAEPCDDLNGDGDCDLNESFLDRNCNGIWDDAETEDVGNGIWDGVETYTDFNDDGVWSNDELFIINQEAVAKTLLVTYTNSENGEVMTSIDFENNNTLVDKWGNSFDILTSSTVILHTEKSVEDLESIDFVYTNRIIEEFDNIVNEEQYTVSKTKSESIDVASSTLVTDYSYILYNVDDEGNINKLTYPSYFLMNGYWFDFDDEYDFHSWYEEDNTNSPPIGFFFEDDAVNETILFSSSGSIRDGERIVSDETIVTEYGEYYVVNSYTVDSDTVTVPLDETVLEGILIEEDCSYLWDAENGICFVDVNGDSLWNDYTFFGGDSCYKVTREISMTLIGPNIEYSEKEISWLVRGFGIVKDDIYIKWPGTDFQFDEEDGICFTGEYCNVARLEIDEFRNGSDLDRQNNFSTYLNINNIQNEPIFDYEPFEKNRMVGLKKINIPVINND